MNAPVSLKAADPVKFHLSLNVADLSKSIEFFRILFGIEPAKVRSDYAKFEPDEPPLVLSLESTPRGAGGALNHLGFRMPDAGSLVRMQERLERAGIRSQREEGVECCYAKQTKFWVYDPDGLMWEVYTFDGDIDHRGPGQLPSAVAPSPAAATPSLASWEHYMGVLIPERLPFGDATLDEIRLRGSFNLKLDAAVRERLLSEAKRVLRPKGRLFAHVLTAESELRQPPQLPGPAAAVQHVPLQSEVIARLEAAEFRQIKLLKFDAKPCFIRDGIAMRETQIEAFAPSETAKPGARVLYRGPFREITDDLGRRYHRGCWTEVDADTAALLRKADVAGSFLVVEI
ncbi:MAG: ArsI/CadI family heavy metal resistance metalloenzyme [Gemmataceae bacterium]